MKAQIIEVLTQLSPYLQRDGGDVRFVDVNDGGVVTVELLGACKSCPTMMGTLKQVIAEQLIYEVDGVTCVVAA
ncbi:MAG: NifU family protein [Culicoidibacterales bacterium]